MSKLLTWLEGTGVVDVEGRGDVMAAGRSSSSSLVEEEEWDSPCPHCLLYPHQVHSYL